MNEIIRQNDKYFKEIFTDRENARGIITLSLPREILDMLDLSTLKLENSSYINEDLRECFADVVYSCKDRMNESIAVTILLEHKSRLEKYTVIQLLKYMVHAWEIDCKQNRRLRPILPIVVYHGQGKWKVRKLSDYFKGINKQFLRFIPEFEYILSDLSVLSDEEIKQRSVGQSCFVPLSILIMKNIIHTKVLARNLEGYFRLCQKEFETEKGLKFLQATIQYILSGSEVAPEKVIAAANAVSQAGGEIAMTTAERLRNEGRLEGRNEGMMKGLMQGRLEGKLEGKEEALIETCQKLLESGVDINIIEKITSFSVPRIKEIEAAMKRTRSDN